LRLYEFQAKELFRRFGILPESSPFVVFSKPVVRKSLLRPLGRGPWIAKAQVLAGGRGKAGGVKRVHKPSELSGILKGWLGRTLVTAQTGPSGEKIRRVLLEKAQPIRRELYLGVVQDRSSARPVLLASSMGGMDIEEVARKNPDQLARIPIDPLTGLLDYQVREAGFALALGPALPAFCRLAKKLSEFYFHYDCTLVEINPLAEIGDMGNLIPLDAKVVIDDNSFYRHPDLLEFRDAQFTRPAERQALKSGISYIRLSGRVGCLVNGAGLAMATMDLIKQHGGEPANFLDVGGGAGVEQVTRAFRILLSDRNVKAVLVNIFGGIMRCDIIAQALTRAVKAVSLRVPLIVRLEGNRSPEGKKILRDSGLRITASEDLSQAAQLAVQAAKA
jgi:succinyl-CoA synthetase beta subunit